MHSMLFTLVPIFIGVCALFVFGSIAVNFFGLRKHHKSIMDRVTTELDRKPRQGTANRYEEREKSSEYSCTNCGAGLDSNTEISPSGDFKCTYCNTWSNVN